MQKKIIALAITAALAAPAFAAADTSNVTVYGKANVSYDMINTGTSTAGVQGVRSNRVSSNVSVIGLKGSEDLGDGLAAVWQIEQQINMADANAAGTTNTFATRNTYAGLKSDSIGTVLLGRHDTPYKIATRGLDQFADNIADNRSLMGLGGAAAFDGRQPDAIAYITPAMSGFTGAIAYVNLNQALNLAQNTAAATKNSAWSLAGLYSNGPFFGSLAYEVHNLPVLIAGGKESATKVGLGYTMDAFNVGFVYEKTTDNLGVGNTNLAGHSAYYLGGKYSFGSNDVKLAYTKLNQIGNVANTGAKQFTLGFDHNLSKRTSVYALYSKISNQSASGFGLSTNGSSATQAGGTIAGIGASPSVLSFEIGRAHV